MSIKKFIDDINQMSDSPFKVEYHSFQIEAMFDNKEDMVDGFIYLIQKTNVKKTLEHIKKFIDLAEIVGKVPEFMDILQMVISSKKIKGNQEIGPELFELYTKLEFTLKYLKNKEIERLNRKTSTTITGFKSSLKDPQIQTLFDQLKGSYIDNKTNPNHFKAIFKDDPLPEGIFINWIHKTTNKVNYNKHSLFDLLKQIRQDVFDPNPYTFIKTHFTIGGKNPTNEQLKTSFSDWNIKNLRKQDKSHFATLIDNIKANQ